MTYEELKAKLSDIEADESTYEGITAEDIGNLERMMESEEPWLAARAVFAASRIQNEARNQVLRKALVSPMPEVRVALAASSRILPPRVSDEMLTSLLDDTDVGVRKFAIKSVTSENAARVQNKVKRLAQQETIPTLRDLSQEKLEELK
jgi:hypothetical protein